MDLITDTMIWMMFIGSLAAVLLIFMRKNVNNSSTTRNLTLVLIIVSIFLFIAFITLFLLDGIFVEVFHEILLPIMLFIIVFIGCYTLMKELIFGTYDPKHLSVATIALIGFPNAGKTVFTTVLFEKLLLRDGTNKNITPYGEETIERISTDFRKLRAFDMLPPTGNDVFYYRAYYSPKRSKPHYKLEIADYAGECLQKELDSNEKFFHKTAYFKYVIKSDVIFLAIDLEKYVEKHDQDERNNYIIDIEESYKSALHMYKEQNSIIISKKSNTPVVLLFLKTDCFDSSVMVKEGDEYIDVSRDHIIEILKRFNQLITYCKNNFTHFNHFFVSAFDEIKELNGMNKDGRSSAYNKIEEPLLWAMERVGR